MNDAKNSDVSQNLEQRFERFGTQVIAASKAIMASLLNSRIVKLLVAIIIYRVFPTVARFATTIRKVLWENEVSRFIIVFFTFFAFLFVLVFGVFGLGEPREIGNGEPITIYTPMPEVENENDEIQLTPYGITSLYLAANLKYKTKKNTTFQLQKVTGSVDALVQIQKHPNGIALVQEDVLHHYIYGNHQYFPEKRKKSNIFAIARLFQEKLWIYGFSSDDQKDAVQDKAARFYTAARFCSDPKGTGTGTLFTMINVQKILSPVWDANRSCVFGNEQGKKNIENSLFAKVQMNRPSLEQANAHIGDEIGNLDGLYFVPFKESDSILLTNAHRGLYDDADYVPSNDSNFINLAAEAAKINVDKLSDTVPKSSSTSNKSDREGKNLTVDAILVVGPAVTEKVVEQLLEIVGDMEGLPTNAYCLELEKKGEKCKSSDGNNQKFDDPQFGWKEKLRDLVESSRDPRNLADAGSKGIALDASLLKERMIEIDDLKDFGIRKSYSYAIESNEFAPLNWVIEARKNATNYVCQVTKGRVCHPAPSEKKLECLEPDHPDEPVKGQNYCNAFDDVSAPLHKIVRQKKLHWLSQLFASFFSGQVLAIFLGLAIVVNLTVYFYGYSKKFYRPGELRWKNSLSIIGNSKIWILIAVVLIGHLILAGLVWAAEFQEGVSSEDSIAYGGYAAGLDYIWKYITTGTPNKVLYSNISSLWIGFLNAGHAVIGFGLTAGTALQVARWFRGDKMKNYAVIIGDSDSLSQVKTELTGNERAWMHIDHPIVGLLDSKDFTIPEEKLQFSGVRSAKPVKELIAEASSFVILSGFEDAPNENFESDFWVLKQLQTIQRLLSFPPKVDDTVSRAEASSRLPRIAVEVTDSESLPLFDDEGSHVDVVCVARFGAELLVQSTIKPQIVKIFTELSNTTERDNEIYFDRVKENRVGKDFFDQITPNSDQSDMTKRNDNRVEIGILRGEDTIINPEPHDPLNPKEHDSKLRAGDKMIVIARASKVWSRD